MTYTLTSGATIIRDVDGAHITPALGSTDYNQYLVWAYGEEAFEALIAATYASGALVPDVSGLTFINTPTPYTAPPATIPNITKRQALLWLLSIGKSESDVLAGINAITDPTQKAAALIEWNYPDGGMIPRANPLSDQLGTALGMTSDQVDAAFVTASKL